MKPNAKYETVPILELQVRELTARIDEIVLFSKATAKLAPKETWEQWAFRTTDYFNARIAELTKQLKEITQ